MTRTPKQQMLYLQTTLYASVKTILKLQKVCKFSKNALRYLHWNF